MKRLTVKEQYAKKFSKKKKVKYGSKRPNKKQAEFELGGKHDFSFIGMGNSY